MTATSPFAESSLYDPEPVAQPAPRKRGRPPKPRDEFGNIIRDGVTTPAPPKAAQPAKPRGAARAEALNEARQAPVVPQEPLEAPQPVAAAPSASQARRGRPPKSAATTIPEADELAETLEAYRVAHDDFKVAQQELMQAREQVVKVLGRAGWETII